LPRFKRKLIARSKKTVMRKSLKFVSMATNKSQELRSRYLRSLSAALLLALQAFPANSPWVLLTREVLLPEYQTSRTWMTMSLTTNHPMDKSISSH